MFYLWVVDVYSVENLIVLSKLKNQHYVPQSYLRGFGEGKKQNFVYSRFEGSPVLRVNVRNICAEGNFYDIPELGPDRSKSIEKFYSERVDGNFPYILKFAEDREQRNLSIDMRGKIIASLVAQIFRVPKFLRNESYINALLPHNNVDVDTRILALQAHLEHQERMIKLKLTDGISINHSQGDSMFITSDNPVLLRGRDGHPVDYFDPTCIIHWPLSPKVSITVTPSRETELKGYFDRLRFDSIQVLSINRDIAKQSEKFIIGSKGGIEKFEKEYLSFNENNPLAVKTSDELKLKAQIMKVLYDKLKQMGIDSKEFKEHLIDVWSKHEFLRSDETIIGLFLYVRKLKG